MRDESGWMRVVFCLLMLFTGKVATLNTTLVLNTPVRTNSNAGQSGEGVSREAEGQWITEDQRWSAEETDFVRRMLSNDGDAHMTTQIREITIAPWAQSTVNNGSRLFADSKNTDEATYYSRQERVCDGRRAELGDCYCRIASYTFRQYRIVSFVGKPQRVSEPVCPPASLTYSPAAPATKSFSVGPSVSRVIPFLQWLSVSASFSYSFATPRTESYSTICTDTGNRPCVGVFLPELMTVTGFATTREVSAKTGVLCYSGFGTATLQVAKKRQSQNTDCNGKKGNPCGPKGTYTHCWISDPVVANQRCPSSGTTWKGLLDKHKACPPSWKF